jgi:hypothetical protein
MPPIQNEVLRFDFNRAVTLKLVLYEEAREFDRREWEWNLARAQAQMIAAMTWCKHEENEREDLDCGRSRCCGCGAEFGAPQVGGDD